MEDASVSEEDAEVHFVPVELVPRVQVEHVHLTVDGPYDEHGDEHDQEHFGPPLVFRLLEHHLERLLDVLEGEEVAEEADLLLFLHSGPVFPHEEKSVEGAQEVERHA